MITNIVHFFSFLVINADNIAEKLTLGCLKNKDLQKKLVNVKGGLELSKWIADLLEQFRPVVNSNGQCCALMSRCSKLKHGLFTKSYASCVYEVVFSVVLGVSWPKCISSGFLGYLPVLLHTSMETMLSVLLGFHFHALYQQNHVRLFPISSEIYLRYLFLFGTLELFQKMFPLVSK